MADQRIHIVGACGSGTSTLRAHLARLLNYKFFDTDDFFWEQTPIPFSVKRPIPERLGLMQETLSQQHSWVLSGHLVRWGAEVVPAFTHVIYLYLPDEIRIPRIIKREQARFGHRIQVDGDMHQAHLGFMVYAKQYEQGGMDIRSKLLHETWLDGLHCKTLKIVGDFSLKSNTKTVLKWLHNHP